MSPPTRKTFRRRFRRPHRQCSNAGWPICLARLPGKIFGRSALSAPTCADVIFMTQQVKLHCPDVQLFTFENHLAFTHPDYARFFEGMLVATTYPLLMDTQSWHLKKPRDFSPIQFSSTSSEGMHNAMLALLNKHPPGKRQSLVDYRYPFSEDQQRRQPPLWLVSIGSNGMWPVVAIPFPACKDKRHVMYADSRRVKSTPRTASGLSRGLSLGPLCCPHRIGVPAVGSRVVREDETVRTQSQWTLSGAILDACLAKPSKSHWS